MEQVNVLIWKYGHNNRWTYKHFDNIDIYVYVNSTDMFEQGSMA